jgi:hypothetical protein
MFYIPSNLISAKNGHLNFQAKLKRGNGVEVPRLAPITSRPCVFWKLTIQKRYTSKGILKWTSQNELFSEHSWMKIYDLTGECYVIPSQAQLDVKSTIKNISYTELKELSALFEDINLKDYSNSLIFRVIEEIIPFDALLTCSGFFQGVEINMSSGLSLEPNKFPLLLDGSSNYSSIMTTNRVEIGHNLSMKKKYLFIKYRKASESLKGIDRIPMLHSEYTHPKRIPLKISTKSLYELSQKKRRKIILFFSYSIFCVFLIFFIVRFTWDI